MGKRGPKPTMPCGTPAAYARHLRKGEQPCDPCRLAQNAYTRSQPGRQAAQKRRFRAIQILIGRHQDEYDEIKAELRAAEDGGDSR